MNALLPEVCLYVFVLYEFEQTHSKFYRKYLYVKYTTAYYNLNVHAVTTENRHYQRLHLTTFLQLECLSTDIGKQCWDQLMSLTMALCRLRATLWGFFKLERTPDKLYNQSELIDQ